MKKLLVVRARGLSADQAWLSARVAKLLSIRASHAALRRGARKTLSVTDDVWVFSMTTAGDTVYVAVNRGDVIFFTTFTVHRTGLEDQGKPCNGLRIGCNFRYENTADPTFVERGFYCAYRRTVAREMVTPNFPRAEQVAALFRG